MTDFPKADLALASLKPFLKVDFPTVDLALASLKPFLKVDDHEQMMSDVLEEIELKCECAPLLKQLINDTVVGKERKELIRILRLKRDRLKVLNPSLFMRSEFDEEHEKIISDVIEEIALNHERNFARFF